MRLNHPNTTGRVAGISFAALLCLSGCVQTVSSPLPETRPIAAAPAPAAVPIPAPSPVILQQTPESLAIKSYYTNVQNGSLTNGLLRTDGGGNDTPFSAHQLARNFDAIALYNEYTAVNGRLIAAQTASQLKKWDAPVRIRLEFGASVPQAQRTQDRQTVQQLSARLARATKHPVTFNSSAAASGNFHVLVLNENERKAIEPRLRQLIPGLEDAALNAVVNMSLDEQCLVIATDPADNGVYRQAVAVIRGEHPSLLRKSCFHEEIAQGLGLANDSPHARPSIFNDDEEFATLTPHDELLLRILYDDRLKPGMSPDTARHISAQIADELLSDRL